MWGVLPHLILLFLFIITLSVPLSVPQPISGAVPAGEQLDPDQRGEFPLIGLSGGGGRLGPFHANYYIKLMLIHSINKYTSALKHDLLLVLK